jgi:molybdopterin-guanine dinucleotide biosynthesis protein A
MNITGVILAGGKSSRMGKDKGLIEINQVPMVCFAIDALSKVTPLIYISANNPDYEQFSLPLIPDLIPGIGPIGGLQATLSQIKTSHILALSADMPLITPRILQILSDHCKPDSEAIVARHKDKTEPLCAVYSVSILTRVNKQIEKTDYSLHNLIELLATEFIDFPTEAGIDPFVNINTPDQYLGING